MAALRWRGGSMAGIRHMHSAPATSAAAQSAAYVSGKAARITHGTRDHSYDGKHGPAVPQGSTCSTFRQFTVWQCMHQAASRMTRRLTQNCKEVGGQREQRCNHEQSQGCHHARQRSPMAPVGLVTCPQMHQGSSCTHTNHRQSPVWPLVRTANWHMLP